MIYMWLFMFADPRGEQPQLWAHLPSPRPRGTAWDHAPVNQRQVKPPRWV